MIWSRVWGYSGGSPESLPEEFCNGHSGLEKITFRSTVYTLIPPCTPGHDILASSAAREDGLEKDKSHPTSYLESGDVLLSLGCSHTSINPNVPREGVGIHKKGSCFLYFPHHTSLNSNCLFNIRLHRHGAPEEGFVPIQTCAADQLGWSLPMQVTID